MKKIYLFLILACAFIQITPASKKEENIPTGKEPFITRNISILIDKEDEFLPEDPIAQPWFNAYLTQELVTQLIQQSGPILSSKHLYNNFIKMRNMFDDFKYPLSLAQKAEMYNKYPNLSDLDKINDLFAATFKVFIKRINNEIRKYLNENISPKNIAEILNKLTEEKMIFTIPVEEKTIEQIKSEKEKFEQSKKVNLKDINFTHNYSKNLKKYIRIFFMKF